MNEIVEIWLDARPFNWMAPMEKNYEYFLCQLHELRRNIFDKDDGRRVEITGIIIDFEQARNLYANLRMNFELEITLGNEPNKICGIPVYEMHPKHTVKKGHADG